LLEGIVVCVGWRVLQGIARAWLSVCGLGLTDVEDDRGADDVVHRVDAASEARSGTLVLSIRNHRVARLLALGSRRLPSWLLEYQRLHDLAPLLLDEL